MSGLSRRYPLSHLLENSHGKLGRNVALGNQFVQGIGECRPDTARGKDFAPCENSETSWTDLILLSPFCRPSRAIKCAPVIQSESKNSGANDDCQAIVGRFWRMIDI